MPKIYTRFYVIGLLVVLILVASKFWYYRVSGLIANDEDLNVPGAVYLRYFCWALIFVTHAFTFLNIKTIESHRTSGIFYIILMYGLAMGVFGGRVSDALQGVVMQAAILSAVAVIAVQLEPDTLFKWTLRVFCVQILISFMIAVVDPASGIIGDGARLSWRGGFTFKLNLGIASGFMILFLYVARNELSRWFLVAMGLITAITMFKSNAVGPLLATGIAIFHFNLLQFSSNRRLSPSVWGIAVFTFYVAVILVAVLILPMVLQALGRDLTFTGRTDIWAFYWPRVWEHWVFGVGPGGFSRASEFTRPLANSFDGGLLIYQPHNTYLALIGDVGLFGMLIHVGVLLYLALVFPNVDRSIHAYLVASIAIFIMIVGFFETLTPYVLSSPMAYLALFYCSRIAYRRAIRKNTAQVYAAPAVAHNFYPHVSKRVSER